MACNFRHGVELAANHDRDSDSTGAITGNLLGALYCVKRIPAAWLAPLELREVITAVAEDLYGFADWDIGKMPEQEAENARVSGVLGVAGQATATVLDAIKV